MNQFFNIIILLGALQGVIISCLLYAAKNNKQSNRLLATLVLLMSLASFNLYGSYRNWFDIPALQFTINFIPLVVVMPMGPLLYFYVRGLIDADFTFSKNYRKHLYTVFIDLVPQLTALIYIVGLAAGIFSNNSLPWGNFIDTYNVYADIPRWMSITVYVWLSAKYIKAYKEKNAAQNENKNLKWLQQFIQLFTAFQVVWFVFLIPYIIPVSSNWLMDKFEWYPIYLPLAVLIYWFGIKGYIIAQTANNTARKNSNNNAVLTAGIISSTIQQLKTCMENDRLFLNPELNLTMLAEHSGIPQKTISAVLNQNMNKGFSEFVNEYRIEAFKKKIREPETDNLTIAGIALECGFSSQATFQRIFKQATGTSPSAFRKAALQNA